MPASPGTHLTQHRHQTVPTTLRRALHARCRPARHARPRPGSFSVDGSCHRARAAPPCCSPAGQFVHSALPSASLYLPSGHAVQLSYGPVYPVLHTQSAAFTAEYLPVRQPTCVTTPGTQRRHGAAGISEMKLCETHSTSDDAPTVALLLTCLARRAIRSAGLRRVFACQTATKRYHTWHAASSWDCRYQRDEAL